MCTYLRGCRMCSVFSEDKHIKKQHFAISSCFSKQRCHYYDVMMMSHYSERWKSYSFVKNVIYSGLILVIFNTFDKRLILIPKISLIPHINIMNYKKMH